MHISSTLVTLLAPLALSPFRGLKEEGGAVSTGRGGGSVASSGGSVGASLGGLFRGGCGSDHPMGDARWQHWYWSANTEYGPPRQVNTSTFYGLEMTVPLDQWTAGEDEMASVTTAIRKASCGVNLNFTNGSCYFKEGTNKSPVKPPKWAAGWF